MLNQLLSSNKVKINIILISNSTVDHPNYMNNAPVEITWRISGCNQFHPLIKAQLNLSKPWMKSKRLLLLIYLSFLNCLNPNYTPFIWKLESLKEVNLAISVYELRTSQAIVVNNYCLWTRGVNFPTVRRLGKGWHQPDRVIWIG